MEKFGQREEENLSEYQSLAGNSHITTFVNPNNISSEETKNESNLFDSSGLKCLFVSNNVF